MFYTYDLSFDRSSSIAHGLALAASTAEASTATPRKGAQSLALATTELQIICGVGDGINSFSFEFSSEFGAGGVAGYVLVNVNKFLKTTEAQVLFLVEPPTNFHLNTKVVLATSSEVARIATKKLAAAMLVVLSGEAIGLRIARPWYVIVALSSPSAPRIIKAITKIAFSVIETEVASATRALGHIVSALSAQTLQTLYKVTNLQHSSSSQRAQVLIRTASKIHSVVSGQAVSLFRSFGKLARAVSAEIVSVARAIPWNIATAAGEAPRLSFGGGNLFARVFGALSAEGVALQRGLAVQRGALDPNVVRLGRSPGKAFSTARAEAFTLLKQAGVLRGATDGSVVTSTRRPGLVKRTAAPSIQALQAAAAHLAAALATISIQALALFTQHVIARSLSLPRPQSSSVSLSSIRTLIRSISATSPQAARVARAMTKSISVATGAAQALARAPGKILGVASSNVGFLLSVATHFFIGLVTSPEVVAQRASHSAVKGATSPETTTVARRRGAFLSAATANVVNVRRGLAILLGLAQQEVASTTNAIAQSITLASAEIAAAIRGVLKTPAVASPESSAIVTRHGSSLGTISSGQVSALRRLTNRLLLVFSPQVVSGGRGNTKILRTASLNAAFLRRPRGLAVHASQGQAAANIVYYHFFVAPWAYQQTSLLPPFGGPAEPPSFGPIDPADQTIFGFDWTSRAYPNDTIISAAVTCVPPYLPFLPGSLFISGNLVEITVPPFPEPVLPTIYSLRCTATFASGRVSSFSIPVPVRTL